MNIETQIIERLIDHCSYLYSGLSRRHSFNTLLYLSGVVLKRAAMKDEYCRDEYENAEIQLTQPFLGENLKKNILSPLWLTYYIQGGGIEDRGKFHTYAELKAILSGEKVGTKTSKQPDINVPDSFWQSLDELEALTKNIGLF